jgi:hypothetical protein
MTEKGHAAFYTYAHRVERKYQEAGVSKGQHAPLFFPFFE